MSQNLDNLASTIADEIGTLDSKSRDIAAASQARYRAAMEPGDQLPTFGEFTPADEEARAQIRDLEAATYNSVMESIDSTMAAGRRDMTAPASADDVATVQLALSRESISGEELLALYERYGSNYQLASAIAERAKKDSVFLHVDSTALLDRDLADSRAASIIGRHSRATRNFGSFTDSPEFIAEYIVDGLTHTDALGRRY